MILLLVAETEGLLWSPARFGGDGVGVLKSARAADGPGVLRGAVSALWRGALLLARFLWLSSSPPISSAGECHPRQPLSYWYSSH